MNNYKLSNIIKKDLKKRFKESEITKCKINLKKIKSLLAENDVCELSDHWYDSNYLGEDQCNWQDVEAPTYGWLFFNRTYNDTCRRIKNMFIADCKQFINNAKNRNIFIAENTKYIWIVLPTRNINSKDTIMILRKK